MSNHKICCCLGDDYEPPDDGTCCDGCPGGCWNRSVGGSGVSCCDQVDCDPDAAAVCDGGFTINGKLFCSGVLSATTVSSSNVEMYGANADPCDHTTFCGNVCSDCGDHPWNSCDGCCSNPDHDCQCCDQALNDPPPDRCCKKDHDGFHVTDWDDISANFSLSPTLGSYGWPTCTFWDTQEIEITPMSLSGIPNGPTPTDFKNATVCECVQGDGQACYGQSYLNCGDWMEEGVSVSKCGILDNFTVMVSALVQIRDIWVPGLSANVVGASVHVGYHISKIGTQECWYYCGGDSIFQSPGDDWVVRPKPASWPNTFPYLRGQSDCNAGHYVPATTTSEGNDCTCGHFDDLTNFTFAQSDSPPGPHPTFNQNPNGSGSPWSWVFTVWPGQKSVSQGPYAGSKMCGDQTSPCYSCYNDGQTNYVPRIPCMNTCEFVHGTAYMGIRLGLHITSITSTEATPSCE